MFNSSGTVNVQTGTLSLDGGGTETGSFTVSSGAALKLTNSTSFTSASTIAGAGNVIFGGGSNTVSGTYNPTGTTTVSTGLLGLIGFLVAGMFDYTYGHSLALILLSFVVLIPLIPALDSEP